ncbi:hypothetical protein E1263_04465 [Kribbella antibiotica]|uniref:DUF6879 domain-containing protein n=1 Tax=Kribbella antibiotica TaxID=190195 RepID=A0A4R4ZTG9_9ACTN|nr:DUF6879 family protein [Kribbella antibiotica]TDD62135.1 hypothetical protein E1263_04465 [Kribbella antibiotica]
MESISVQRRGELVNQTYDLLKLELRDSYKVDEEDLAAWRARDYATLEASYGGWRDAVATRLAQGKTLRRVRVVSEPLSEYQQMSLRFSGSAVDAGEDLRWLPRRLVSAIALPGNDCFVLDGRMAMFNILDGDNDRSEIQLDTEPEAVKFCLEAFETAWSLAVPHHEYRPQETSRLP